MAYRRIRYSVEDGVAEITLARPSSANAMDATMVDITHIPATRIWDEVVLMGKQGDQEIDAHEIARLKNSVSYDVLAGWRARLPRIYKDER